jgi:hypothetical protein
MNAKINVRTNIIPQTDLSFKTNKWILNEGEQRADTKSLNIDLLILAIPFIR